MDLTTFASVMEAIEPVAWQVIVLILALVLGPLAIAALSKVSKGKVGPLTWENELRTAVQQSSEAASLARQSFGTIDELSIVMAKSRITELELVLVAPGFSGGSYRQQLERQIADLRALIDKLETSQA